MRDGSDLRAVEADIEDRDINHDRPPPHRDGKSVAGPGRKAGHRESGGSIGKW